MNRFLSIAALSGAATVILSALGAHALKDAMTERAVFDSALRMQMFHTVALLFVGMALDHPRWQERSRLLQITGWLFVAGLVLFSASLITYAMLTGTTSGDYGFLRKPAPFGGVSWIAGWVVLLVWSLRGRPHSAHPPL